MKITSKKFLLAVVSAFLPLLIASCGGKDPVAPEPEPDTDPVTPVTPTPSPSGNDPVPVSVTFAKGADIGWASEMENDKVKFYDASGKEGDIFTVLKSVGVNSVRLRVFVDPYGGWSGKEDVLKQAKRAHEAGLGLMIDFHYSDFFADPGRQQVPASWKGLSLSEMTTKVSDHTKDVLQALKDAGIAPNWVQVGNETRNGMIWDTGRLWTDSGDIADGRKHFVTLFNAGYDAAKSVFPNVVVMPHVDNAYDDNDWWFKQMKDNGIKFDAIALSHYPQADNSSHDWKWFNSEALSRIKALISKYGVPVYVSEVGIRLTVWKNGANADNTEDAAKCLSEFVSALKDIKDCRGVFYWEPEVYGDWTPSVYKDKTAIQKYTGKSETWGSYPMGAFTSEGRPSKALTDAYK